MQTLHTQQADKEIDMLVRRAEVVRRLLDRGLSVHLLQAILPGWEDVIALATAHEPPRHETA